MAAGSQKWSNCRACLLMVELLIKLSPKLKLSPCACLLIGLSMEKVLPSSSIFLLLRHESMVISKSQACSRSAAPYRLDYQAEIWFSQNPFTSWLA